jgi:hypothetical protein
MEKKVRVYCKYHNFNKNYWFNFIKIDVNKTIPIEKYVLFFYFLEETFLILFNLLLNSNAYS